MSVSRRLVVDLPEAVLAALAAAAARNGRSLDAELRVRLQRSLAPNLTAARTSGRTEEPFLAPLRALLAQDLADATDWSGLQARLIAKGYSLRERGGGLALHRLSDGVRLCKASELGIAYASLIRRFGAPFPEHSHGYMTQHALAGHRRRPSVRPAPDRDDTILIEPG